MHSKYSELTRSQQSERYYSGMLNSHDPILQNRPDYRASHYPRMLVDDLMHGIFPYALKRNHTVELVTDHSKLSEIISFALDPEHFYGRADIKSSLRSFLHRVIQSLGYYGQCVYEIVELLNPSTLKVEAITLSFIPSLTIFKKKKKWLQYVPLEIARERGTEQYISLSKERLLIFEFPKQYQKSWMARIKSLANVSEITPSFGLPSLQNSHHKIPFDFTEHSKLREQIATRLTNDIGWNLRKYPHDGMTEYYWFHRRLLFEKFKLELRESLLSTLNEGIARAGIKLGMHGQIKIEGFPMVPEIEQAQLDLKSGNRSPEDILDQFDN